MVEIKPIEPHQIDQAKQVVMTVSLEIWQGTVTAEELRRYDPMTDIENVQSHYLENRGTFLVLIDGESVVGTGGIRRLDDATCELKRMWFLPAYRGQGFGWTMAQWLFDFARQAGYRTVRLDLADPARQASALKLYQKLGFYSIERYNDSLCTVFMEKVL